MTDETLIGRAIKRARQEDPALKTDWMKYVPLVVMLASGFAGYKVLEFRVDALAADFKELKADVRTLERKP